MSIWASACCMCLYIPVYLFVCVYLRHFLPHFSLCTSFTILHTIPFYPFAFSHLDSPRLVVNIIHTAHNNENKKIIYRFSTVLNVNRIYREHTHSTSVHNPKIDSLTSSNNRWNGCCLCSRGAYVIITCHTP